MGIWSLFVSLTAATLGRPSVGRDADVGIPHCQYQFHWL